MRTKLVSIFFYTVLVLMFTVFQQPLAQADRVNGNKWKVEQGDTLYSIARALYPGDNFMQGKARFDIVSLNPEVFENGPSSMKGGSLLKLPDYVGKPADKPETSSTSAIGPGGRWAVKKGDTLALIARALFPGNQAKQAQVRHDIMVLNPEVFRDGTNNLKAGTFLGLPAYLIEQPIKPISHPAPITEPTPAAIPSLAPPAQPNVTPESLPVVKLEPRPQENTEPSTPAKATDK